MDVGFFGRRKLFRLACAAALVCIVAAAAAADSWRVETDKSCIVCYIAEAGIGSVKPSGRYFIDDGSGKEQHGTAKSLVAFIVEMQGKGWQLSQVNPTVAGQGGLPVYFLFFQKP